MEERLLTANRAQLDVIDVGRTTINRSKSISIKAILNGIMVRKVLVVIIAATSAFVASHTCTEVTMAIRLMRV